MENFVNVTIYLTHFQWYDETFLLNEFFEATPVLLVTLKVLFVNKTSREIMLFVNFFYLHD